MVYSLWRVKEKRNGKIEEDEEVLNIVFYTNGYAHIFFHSNWSMTSVDLYMYVCMCVCIYVCMRKRRAAYEKALHYSLPVCLSFSFIYRSFVRVFRFCSSLIYTRRYINWIRATGIQCQLLSSCVYEHFFPHIFC